MTAPPPWPASPGTASTSERATTPGASPAPGVVARTGLGLRASPVSGVDGRPTAGAQGRTHPVHRPNPRNAIDAAGVTRERTAPGRGGANGRGRSRLRRKRPRGPPSRGRSFARSTRKSAHGPSGVTEAPPQARPPNGPDCHGQRGPRLGGQVQVVGFAGKAADFGGGLGHVQDQHAPAARDIVRVGREASPRVPWGRRGAIACGPATCGGRGTGVGPRRCNPGCNPRGRGGPVQQSGPGPGRPADMPTGQDRRRRRGAGGWRRPVWGLGVAGSNPAVPTNHHLRPGPAAALPGNPATAPRHASPRDVGRWSTLTA
jgi:hypothetical protein